jgi:hypothetical protein
LSSCNEIDDSPSACTSAPFSYLIVAPDAVIDGHPTINGVVTNSWVVSKSELNPRFKKTETDVMQWNYRDPSSASSGTVAIVAQPSTTTQDLLLSNLTNIRNWTNVPIHGLSPPVGHLQNETLSNVRNWIGNWTSTVSDQEFAPPSAGDPRCTEYEYVDSQELRAAQQLPPCGWVSAW